MQQLKEQIAPLPGLAGVISRQNGQNLTLLALETPGLDTGLKARESSIAAVGSPLSSCIAAPDPPSSCLPAQHRGRDDLAEAPRNQASEHWQKDTQTRPKRAAQVCSAP